MKVWFWRAIVRKILSARETAIFVETMPRGELWQRYRKAIIILLAYLGISFLTVAVIYGDWLEDALMRGDFSTPIDLGEDLLGSFLFWGVVFCILVPCYGVFLALRSVARRRRSIHPTNR